MDGTDLENIASLAERSAFVRILNKDSTIGVPDRMNDEEEIWDIEVMVTAEEIATAGARGKLR